MAINVQAAPVVNRMLHKQNCSYSASLNVLQLRVATIRNDKGEKKKQNKYKKNYIYTCTIYKRIPVNDETPIHHTPLLFFPLPLYDPELIHDVMMETHGA